MDAAHEVANFDPRWDAMACAALLLAMVIGAMFSVLAIHLPAELF